MSKKIIIVGCGDIAKKTAEKAAEILKKASSESQSVRDNEGEEKFKNGCLHCGKELHSGMIFCNEICNYKHSESE